MARQHRKHQRVVIGDDIAADTVATCHGTGQGAIGDVVGSSCQLGHEVTGGDKRRGSGAGGEVDGDQHVRN